MSQPTVDSSRLPAPSTPAPPRPTVQRIACTIPETVHTDPAPANPLAMLELDAVWHLSRGAGQVVAVIDTGVAPHPRFAHLEAGGDYVSTGDGTQDCDGHGTVVAGIIAARPDSADPTGFSGLAPEATVLSIRQSSNIFGAAEDPNATGFGDVETMAMAVRTAADHGATVINISSVACAAGFLDDTALGAALAYAVDTKDAVVVAAAGNGAGQCPAQPPDAGRSWKSAVVAVSPAWYDDYVLTVGSVGNDGAPSGFSLPGPWVDVAAPGEQMVSLSSDGRGVVDAVNTSGRRQPISGTSYAAPVVSGLAALIRAQFPELSARQVMARIEATTHRLPDGWNPLMGNGIVDPATALGVTATESAAAPAPTPPASETQARAVAIAGSAVCVILLGGALAVLTMTARLRRAGGPVQQ